MHKRKTQSATGVLLRAKSQSRESLRIFYDISEENLASLRQSETAFSLKKGKISPFTLIIINIIYLFTFKCKFYVIIKQVFLIKTTKKARFFQNSAFFHLCFSLFFGFLRNFANVFKNNGRAIAISFRGFFGGSTGKHQNGFHAGFKAGDNVGVHSVTDHNRFVGMAV